MSESYSNCTTEVKKIDKKESIHIEKPGGCLPPAGSVSLQVLLSFIILL